MPQASTLHSPPNPVAKHQKHLHLRSYERACRQFLRNVVDLNSSSPICWRAVASPSFSTHRARVSPKLSTPWSKFFGSSCVSWQWWPPLSSPTSSTTLGEEYGSNTNGTAPRRSEEGDGGRLGPWDSNTSDCQRRHNLTKRRSHPIMIYRRRDQNYINRFLSDRCRISLFHRFLASELLQYLPRSTSN